MGIIFGCIYLKPFGGSGRFLFMMISICLNFNAYVDKNRVYYYTIDKLTREG